MRKMRKHFKAFKTSVFVQERVDNAYTKSNSCAHVLSCSVTFNGLLCRTGLCKKESQSLNNLVVNGALYAIVISVPDIGVIYLWPWV